MIEFPNAVLPPGERQWHVLTCFDTLIFYDSDSGELRHGEVRLSPRNMTVTQSIDGVAITINGHSAPDPKVSTIEGMVRLMQTILIVNAGPEQNVAFSRKGKLLTARPDGSIAFETRSLRAWEVLRLVPQHHLDSEHYWLPTAPQGGTQLMLEKLRSALGEETERINLQLNYFSPSAEGDSRPLVVWIHNEPQAWQYQWCRDPKQVEKVSRFVFVSQWQRQQFVETFELPLERCDVIRNAIETNSTIRSWPGHSQWRWRCAYISAPLRGLDILLDAWQELSPANAELHIWSGLSLWKIDDTRFRPLFARAAAIPNVTYHRIAPNATIRAALLDMHFLVYPCTYDETFCLSIVEAMSAGCRVIAPARAALPETTAGFARLYPFVSDQLRHTRAFIHALADELANPWDDRPDLAEAQQAYCRTAYDWSGRLSEWRRLIDSVNGQQREVWQ